jgi:hypothetical protein
VREGRSPGQGESEWHDGRYDCTGKPWTASRKRKRQRGDWRADGARRASPGTITGVITLAVAHAKLLPVTVLVAVAVGALGMWVVMVLLSRGDRVQEAGFCTMQGRNLWD